LPVLLPRTLKAYMGHIFKPESTKPDINLISHFSNLIGNLIKGASYFSSPDLLFCIPIFHHSICSSASRRRQCAAFPPSVSRRRR
jgi:hypothetical protein